MFDAMQAPVADGLSLSFRWQGEAFEPLHAIENRALSVLPRTPTMAQILAFERLLLSFPQSMHADLGVIHHQAPGVYMREGVMSAGTYATGRQHKTEHFSILLSGTITVWTEGGMRTLSAPQIVRSLPGAKRVGYAHTDVRWMTVHATNETDIAKIEAMLTYPPDVLLPGGTA